MALKLWFSHVPLAALLLVSSADFASAAPVRKAVAKPAGKQKVLTAGEKLRRAFLVNSFRAPGQVPGQCYSEMISPLALTLWDLDSVLNDDKGEFETSAAYEDRKATLEGAIHDFGPIYTCWRLNSDDVGIKFDADRSRFTSELWSRVLVHDAVRDLPRANGITRGGVKFSYDRESGLRFYVNYHLEMPSVPSQCLKTEKWGTTRLLVDMPFTGSAAQALALKNQGFVIIKADVVRPFASQKTDKHIPSLTEDWQTYVEEYAVEAAPLSIEVIDQKGNTVWSCGGDGQTNPVEG